jgi:DNA-binding XRE family transcriptional regulator
MARLTLEELRAKYPPTDKEEYDRAYAAAVLAGHLAELVYAMRAKAGMTQAELARRIGTTQSSIARVEGSGSLPTLDILVKIARATGTSLRLVAPGVADVEITAED